MSNNCLHFINGKTEAPRSEGTFPRFTVSVRGRIWIYTRCSFEACSLYHNRPQISVFASFDLSLFPLYKLPILSCLSFPFSLCLCLTPFVSHSFFPTNIQDKISLSVSVHLLFYFKNKIFYLVFFFFDKISNTGLWLKLEECRNV